MVFIHGTLHVVCDFGNWFGEMVRGETRYFADEDDWDPTNNERFEREIFRAGENQDRFYQFNTVEIHWSKNMRRRLVHHGLGTVLGDVLGEETYAPELYSLRLTSDRGWLTLLDKITDQ